MKTLQTKLPDIFLVISLITILSLSNCGQQNSDKKADVTTEPVKEEVKPPAVNTDTTTTVPVTTVNNDKTNTTQPADKTKVTEPVKKPVVVQPVVTNNKPVTNTNITPTVTKPVVKTEDPPVIVADPVKPTVETKPKTEEVTKPVVVDKPQPVQDDWVVPAKYKTMTSPFAVDKESLDLGKNLYGTHCKSCHGTKGEGNGPKAAQIDAKMRSFLSAEFKMQKPGEVFYKTIFGRKDMPKYENKIPDNEERWAVVNYIISLK